MEPAWKRFVDELKSRGHQSEYLERLQERLPTRLSNTHDLAQEILKEMATSLGRAEDKVNLALLQLELRAREIAEHEAAPRDAAWRAEMNRRIGAYNVQRDAAADLLWEFTVHRETLGLRCDAAFYEYYPIPRRRDPLP